jgi:hypothetical protein
LTRFSELKRIESAIKDRDKAQLEWAAGYCKMRLAIAQRKDHQKYWRRIEQTVRKALEDPK